MDNCKSVSVHIAFYVCVCVCVYMLHETREIEQVWISPLSSKNLRLIGWLSLSHLVEIKKCFTLPLISLHVHTRF
jgi:hypothetical protein